MQRARLVRTSESTRDRAHSTDGSSGLRWTWIISRQVWVLLFSRLEGRLSSPLVRRRVSWCTQLLWSTACRRRSVWPRSPLEAPDSGYYRRAAQTQGSKVINTAQYLHKHKGQRSSTLLSIYTNRNTRVKGHQHCSVFTQTETQGSKVINTAQYLHKQKHKGRRSSTLRSIHTQ